MTKYNFIRVITFISILVLFFAQSVYDPSVHAKMQSIDDEDLSEINAKALDIDFTNFTVRAVVNGFQLKDPVLGKGYDSINIDKLEIGQADSSGGVIIGPTNMSSTMSWDLGTKTTPTTKTWILGTNIIFPTTNNGMSLVASNLYLGVDGTSTPGFNASDIGTPLFIANRVVLGNIVFGRDVAVNDAVGPDLDAQWYSPFTAPWMIISAEGTVGGRGLEFYGEIAGYIDQLRLDWTTDAPSDPESLRVNGIYIYGLMNDPAAGTMSAHDTTGGGSVPNAVGANWTTRTGAMKIGGDYATFYVTGANEGEPTGNTISTYASIDVGSPSASTTSSRVRINAPFAGSIRIREFHLGSTNFGPIALDDLVFYRSEIIFKDLNKL